LAVTAAWQQMRRQGGKGGQRDSGDGSALALVAEPRQSVGNSVAAVAGARQ
jgi:hypothetical protein